MNGKNKTMRTKQEAKQELIDKLMFNNSVQELAWMYVVSRAEIIKRLEQRFYIYSIGGKGYAKINFEDRDSGVKVIEAV